jgi:ribosomal protein S17
MHKHKTKKMEKKKNKVAEAKMKPLVEAGEKPVSLRGRKFEGYVIRKFPKRVTIQFERTKFIKKYERYTKFKTKIHARLPEIMKDEINIGDYIQVIECRPLSKITHHVVLKKIRGESEK